MRERPKYQSQIEERIMGYPYGTAFSASDFFCTLSTIDIKSGLKKI